MSIWKSTIVAGSALGTLITLSAINTTTAGQGYHGLNMPGAYHKNKYDAGPGARPFIHPIYGHSFLHPVYGYQFKHPVHGYMPMSADRYNFSEHHGDMRGGGSMNDAGYMLKAGMYKVGSHKTEATKQTIVEVAVGAGSFNTLVTAIEAAGLVETLQGTGPFTVFAPTDEAFAKIPKADLDALLADKAKLTAVLTYHVVPGKLLAADVVKLSEAKTVQGESVNISVADGVKVNNATVVKTDIMASNGVIHVIDTVLMPK